MIRAISLTIIVVSEGLIIVYLILGTILSCSFSHFFLVCIIVYYSAIQPLRAASVLSKISCQLSIY